MKAKRSSSSKFTPPKDQPVTQRALEFLRDFDAAVHPFGDHNGNAQHPFAKGGSKTAVDDPDDVREVLNAPGVTGYCVFPTGGFMVVDADIDPEKGKDGFEALAKLFAEHEKTLA